MNNIVDFDTIKSDAQAREVFENGNFVSVCGNIAHSYNELMDFIVIYHL